jgi:hypothetical protein
MTSGQIVGKISPRKLLNVPLYNGWGAQLKGDSKEDGVIPVGAFVKFFPDNRKGYKLHGKIVKQHVQQGKPEGSAGKSKKTVSYDIDIVQWNENEKKYFTPTDENNNQAFSVRTGVSEAQIDFAQEAKNRPNIDWQDKIHRGILWGLRNISETP